VSAALLFCLILQGDAVGRVPYTQLATRAETDAAMREALQPTRATWGDFHALTPFPYAGHGQRDLATPFPPEEELARYRANGPGPDLARVYAGKHGAPAAWRNLGRRAGEPISLHDGDDPELNDLVQGYLYATLTSPVKQSLELSMGSDDGLRVWLNGKLIHDLDVPRGLDPTADRVRFDLAAGVNHVLFKICDGVMGFDFQVLARDGLGEREDALLAYYLDRDFPPTPERAHYRALTVPLAEGQSLEVGGLAFLSDGRPLVSTRRGEVWILERGFGDPPVDATWKLFAEGLHEPLGLAVRPEQGGDAVYAVQRGELTRILDRDGDEVADRYETACDGWGVSGNYHEFAFGPVFDEEGYAWVTLNVGFCGSLGKALVPGRGAALRIAPDGTAEVWADGLRSPNGIARFRGETFYVDNQGDYVATNRLSHLARGSWHGHPASLRWRAELGPDERPPRQPASVWFPYKKMGQSAADIAVCEQQGRFGPFDGQLFVGDQTLASVMRVSLEQVDGVWQGACYPFFSGLDCGVNRLAFAPDGSLFVGQTDRGWGSVGRRRQGLQRLVYTGRPPFELRELRATPEGFELEFTEVVDAPSALAGGACSLSSYTYEYHPAYGAPEVDALELTVSGVSLADERTLRLAASPLRAGYVHELHLAGIKSAQGEPLLHAEAYYTLERVPPAPGSTAESAPPGARVLLGGGARDPAALWSQKDGRPLAWTLRGDVLAAAPGAGDLVSRAEFGDQRAHVEFRLPPGGNSGVYLQGRYEVQVLDSFGRAQAELRSGDCGGLYGIAAPAVNACRPAGEWQTLEVLFRAPRITDAEGKTASARASVWLNGVRVQDDVELPAPTPGGLDAHEYQRGPLLLQDHGDAVEFRNVWVEDLDHR
jgi:glucose/arabinose dehydrogenase